MSRKHTKAQMIAAVKQFEAGRKAEDVARELREHAHDFRLGVKSEHPRWEQIGERLCSFPSFTGNT